MGHKTMTLKNRNYKYVQGTQEQVEKWLNEIYKNTNKQFKEITKTIHNK